MVRPDNAKQMQQPPPRFNATRVLVWTAVALLLFLLGAWLLVGHTGHKMEPKVNRPEAPNAVWPAQPPRTPALRQI